jgi:hypothetical protein
LYRRMGDTSVLMAYQHWAHVKRDEAFSTVAGRIHAVLPEALPPVCISSGSIGFFAIAKRADLLAGVRDTMEKYAVKSGFTVYPKREEASLFTTEGTP